MPSVIDGCGKLKLGTSCVSWRLSLGETAVAQSLRGDDVDRDRAIGDGAVGAAGAGDDDRLLIRGVALSLNLGRCILHRFLVLLRLRRSGDREAAEAGKQQ